MPTNSEKIIFRNFRFFTDIFANILFVHAHTNYTLCAHCNAKRVCSETNTKFLQATLQNLTQRLLKETLF
jgi:hypothetical protein